MRSDEISILKLSFEKTPSYLDEKNIYHSEMDITILKPSKRYGMEV